MKLILKNKNLVFQSGTFDVEAYIDGNGMWGTQIENPEFSHVIVDSEDRILWGRYQDYPTTADYEPDLGDATIDGVSVQKIVNTIKSTLQP